MDVTTMYRTVVFVGDHPLLVACADRAREAGLDVVAVSTQDASIAEWADGEGIARVAWKDLAGHLERQRPDVLLSVGNLRILPDEMVEATRITVNFHDGPLPAYAGLHTPMWALLAGEKDYGVTWHAVEGGIDEGSILATRSFEIADDETTQSLNFKCFGAAGDAFEDLLAQLTAGRLDRTDQVGEGQYFGRYDRPLPAGALVPHAMSATEIDRVVRALDFGQTINRVGRPLLQVDDTHLMVVQSATLADTTRAGPPGSVLAASTSGPEVTLTVTTATDPVVLQGWVEDDVDAAALVGRVLPDPTPVLPDLEKLHGASARSEVWWSKRIAAIAPVDLGPQVDGEGQSTAQARVAGASGFEDAAALAAAFVLGRAGQHRGTIGVATPQATDRGVSPWFATVVPVTVEVDPDRPVTATLDDLRSAVNESRERGPYLRDLAGRMPVQAPGPVTDPALSVAIVTEGVTSGAALQIEVVGDGASYQVRARGDDAGLAGRIARGLEAFAAAAALDGDGPLGRLPTLADDEVAELLDLGGQPADLEFAGPLHEQFGAIASSTPDAVALVHRGREITYGELDRSARRVASALQRAGVEPGGFVAVSCAPSIDMIVAVLGVLMAGAAYVPLDPRFPAERLCFMIEDARVQLVLTDDLGALPDGAQAALDIAATAADESVPVRDILPPVSATDLAYVMYTSGSTGRPKGVMVEHGNVDSFLQSMEPHVGTDDGVWLSVTTLSFDISVLEIFYPLVHGWKVVLYEGLAAARPTGASRSAESSLDISLFFFGSEGTEGGGEYRLLLDVARYGDNHGFRAVWTPERHFNAFGGPFPNPSVTGAALAAVTERIDIRAGSCVLPLHHPVRAAEEWAVVDRISGGRVGLSIAAGWHPEDFVLRPENFGQPKTALLDQIDQLRRLWRGEAITYEGPKGPVEVTTLPRPVQRDLPIWYTTAGNIESFELAGANGFNLLTHLLGQRLEDLATKVEAYRRARAEAGHPGRGTVSLMLHTFVTGDASIVRETVREPMKSYLRDSIALVKEHASAFPTFDPTKTEADGALAGLSPEDLDALLEVAFARYFETSGLFGDVDQAIAIAREIESIDIDEIAALVDFGVDEQAVLDSLPHLDRVRAAFVDHGPVTELETYGSLIETHGVTHLQCTPSEARIVLADDESRAALGSLRCMLVGGEALPASVAAELHDAVGGQLLDVYGPTETTIWSTVHPVTTADIDRGAIPIGRPLANTCCRVVGEDGRLRPRGAIGELLIGGRGVTPGYHDRPELTAERFVTRDDTRGTVYRTGDLVRWRPDGTLAFHGRADSQVKVRGHRIELGEIEAALESRADTAEAAVVVQGEGDGAALVAHLVASGTAESPASIQAALARTLPAHMVPERFRWHDALPTTPNGKVDRKALLVAAPETKPPAMVKSALAPEATATEPAAPVAPAAGGPALSAGDAAGIISDAWQDVLGVDTVDRNISFFDHGGNSLQVVTLRHALEERLGRPVSLVDLFRYGTVNELADAFAAQPGPEIDDETADDGRAVAPGASASSRDRAGRRAAARRKARRSR